VTYVERTPTHTHTYLIEDLLRELGEKAPTEVVLTLQEHRAQVLVAHDVVLAIEVIETLKCSFICLHSQAVCRESLPVWQDVAQLSVREDFKIGLFAGLALHEIKQRAHRRGSGEMDVRVHLHALKKVRALRLSFDHFRLKSDKYKVSHK
jgi:hypothetical protein